MLAEEGTQVLLQRATINASKSCEILFPQPELAVQVEASPNIDGALDPYERVASKKFGPRSLACRSPDRADMNERRQLVPVGVAKPEVANLGRSDARAADERATSVFA